MKTCNRCIMSDAADPKIKFDGDGNCNYCTDAISKIGTVYFPDSVGEKKLEEMLSEIKAYGVGKKYDCAMGISGGLDSSYLAYLGFKWGLRILAVHIDDGYDTEISKSNIRKLTEAAHLDMKIVSPDSKQFNALTRAYMLAGVPNLAIPQDNILFAFLYDEIKKNGIRYFLSGENFALECVLQSGNTHPAIDVVNIHDIAKRFDSESIDKLKFISSYRKYIDMKTSHLVTYKPLNYIDYNRDKAFMELHDFCGFEYYGRKHLENILTAFIQLYWLPKKFNVDKRSSHLSSMIVSGQMTREEALRDLSEPMYDPKQMEQYIMVIKDRIGLSDEEFDEIMKAPVHQHTDYKYDKFNVRMRRFFK